MRAWLATWRRPPNPPKPGPAREPRTGERALAPHAVDTSVAHVATRRRDRSTRCAVASTSRESSCSPTSRSSGWSACYPYSPDTLVDVVVEHDRVSIRLAGLLPPSVAHDTRPGARLVATGQSLAAVRGSDPEGPLARAIAKVAGVLGVDPATVEVDLGEAESVTLDLLRRAQRRTSPSRTRLLHLRPRRAHPSHRRSLSRLRRPGPVVPRGVLPLEQRRTHLSRRPRTRRGAARQHLRRPPTTAPELGIFRADRRYTARDTRARTRRPMGGRAVSRRGSRRDRRRRFACDTCHLGPSLARTSARSARPVGASRGRTERPRAAGREAAARILRRYANAT